MHRSLFPFLSLLFLLPASLSGQGHLLLVGGGAESQGGWSDVPYRWLVDQAPNHRVAIISYRQETQWLPDYFMSLGAHFARNFYVTDPISASSQGLYDSLATYDAIFFKGGDQTIYYENYRNTLLEQAVEETFAAGGVIGGTSAGMAILSEVLFSAENGSAYPEDVLANVDDAYVVLKNNFLSLNQGLLFDTHFVERGRFGRLAGFLARWYFDRGEILLGIGVDDKTALAIDTLQRGQVYGTGAVTLMSPYGDPPFRRGAAGQPLADSLQVRQLLDGDLYRFNLDLPVGLSRTLVPPKPQETGGYTLLLSGGDMLSDNDLLLDELVFRIGQPSDPILIVSQQSTEAMVVASMLQSRGVGEVYQLRTEPGFQELAAATDAIGRMQKFLFVANDPAALQAYLAGGSNGQLLNARLREEASVLAFIGEDSRLAGKVLVENYRQRYAAYDGLLQRSPGLGLLQTSIVMPNAFADPDFVENTAAGVPWVMVQDSLAYGLWLMDSSFVRYEAAGNIRQLQAYGKYPLLLQHNPGTSVDTARPFGGISRNVAGFGQMWLSLTDSTPVVVGRNLVSEAYQPEKASWLSVYPNPVGKIINILCYGGQRGAYTFDLLDQQGRRLLTHTQLLDPNTASVEIPVPDLAPGVYTLMVQRFGAGVVTQLQIIR